MWRPWRCWAEHHETRQDHIASKQALDDANAGNAHAKALGDRLRGDDRVAEAFLKAFRARPPKDQP